jgi:hypothetical protein
MIETCADHARRRSIASHQIGTTVRVENFFGKIPVRKQTAEKNASKCLAGIRKLLQAYALTRPKVRLQLRVLKAQSEKSNFTYGPGAGGATVQDAAFKVIGKEPASQCSWADLEAEPFEIRALLPSPDAAPSKISNVGHFLSIDYRPVTTTRGFFKTIVKRVVDKIRDSSDTLSAVKDPFFVLNIICPQGSYDPNVEPAKDDVIFDDGDHVLKVLDELLSAVYPNRLPEEVIEDLPIQAAMERHADADESIVKKRNLPDGQLLEGVFDADDDLETLEGYPSSHRHAPAKGHDQRGASNQEDDADDQLPKMLANINELKVLEARVNIWRSSMYGCDEDDLELFAMEEQTRPASAEAEFQKDPQKSLNPWTIAKLNVPVKPRVTATTDPDRRLPTPRARSVSPAPSRRSYTTQADRRLTPLPSDEKQLPSLPWQSHVRKEVPFIAGQMFPEWGRRQQSQLTGLPSPLASSDPVQEISQQKVQRQKQTNRSPTINKAPVPPSRIFNSNSEYGPGPYRRQKRPQNPKSKGRDLQELLTGPSHVPQNAALLSQGEPTEVTVSDNQIEGDFRAHLRQAGEGLSLQYAHRVMARHPETEDQATSPNVPLAINGPWTSINAALEQTVEPIPHSLSKRGRNIKSKRTKSSTPPLERVPDGCETQHIVQHMMLSSAKLESLDYFFSRKINDLNYGEPAEYTYSDLPDRFSESMLLGMGLKAVDMLRSRLRQAEQSGDEGVILTYVGTLARLERTEDVDVVA